ncbi:UDP-N-acetylmuramate:L-alanyl-gamma-D-glutamyl-meso-diaminopimelate ligase [Gammaproteobacteria bacterium]|nr:UDP-N-acetylmuramate:L-alanyl-gamma-D-glutamyl-meso-diaminopimelate ligase [Gammaproteobacteria bacterium]
MKIHILGICGTFMGGLAQILKESGHEISGSDQQFYPPMSEHLQELDIKTYEGYVIDDMPKADLYVIGNALSRGNICVEFILENKLPYKSGPEMLGEILKDREVIAISGTHGKTSTAYMTAHILLSQGIDIGFLVGGISSMIDGSARLGSDKLFVIEADEYDSAFFDKRSKFIHYSPNTLVINNIEFDHADIFDNLDAIKKQFHHLVKIIPSNGNIIYFKEDKNTLDLLGMGSWSKLIPIGKDEDYELDLDENKIKALNKEYSLEDFTIFGSHNAKNIIAAITAAQINGISVQESINALKKFDGVKRRLETKYKDQTIQIIDDFAHHPTAIRYAIDAVKTKFKDSKILGLIELGSNTMSQGVHGDNLLDSASELDKVLWLDSKKVLSNKTQNCFISDEACLNSIKDEISSYDIFLIMTNKNSKRLWGPIIEYIKEK